MSWQVKLDRVRDSLLDLIFPPQCVCCGARGPFLCARCRGSFPALAAPVCDVCGVPVSGGGLCARCQESRLAIDGIRSAYRHTGSAREAVHHFKYRNLKVMAKPLAQLMAEYLASNPMPADVLAAVPAHQRKIRQRGYNQAVLLAEELGRLMNIPVSAEALARVRSTPPQVALGAEARRANVRGAFRSDDKDVRDKRVLLIDDVCTTGATMEACAIALKEAGAASVRGLTFSREC